jgi:ubiquinone/menaquinone biosynthesis C-methylase UbiE
LEDYQLGFVAKVQRVIGANWFLRKPRLRILDMGCDTSGAQLRLLSELTAGEVVGINIPATFPNDQAQALAGPNVTLLRMDGMELLFPDESFDLVISANVMEHVPDPRRFISEAARVIRPDGVVYMETAPLWSSARGHHIHEEMIGRYSPEERNYRNDGSVIPDWSHLVLTRQAMHEVLKTKLLPATCDYILHYLYDLHDLNETPWSVIRSAFTSAFRSAKISTWHLTDADERLRPTDDAEDYSVYGFSAVLRKTPPNPVKRRLYWRLRRLGL